ncbi:MAG: hypothetical protein K0R98_1576 [Rickettsiaceae bacterium]|nr:hypothetical protein [Rickettsiaceae bacterium]
MAAVAEKKEDNTESPESPSMEEILKSIRGVISGDEEPAANASNAHDDDDNAHGDDDELLELTEELTEMAEEVPVATSADSAAANAGTVDAAAPAVAETMAVAEEKSVLDDIDAALSTSEPEMPEVTVEVASETVSQAPQLEPEPEKPVEVETPASAKDVLEAIEPEKAEVDDAVSDSTKSSSKPSERLIQDKVADESVETLKALVNNIPRTHVSSPYTKGGITLEELTIEAMKPFLADWLNQNLPTIVKQIVSKEIKKLIPEEEDK